MIESARKPIQFQGSALKDLRAFPQSDRLDAGHQLDLVQRGLDPDDWKPISSIGRGVREIRIRGEAGAFRVIYVANFPNAIYVLHCFQKKSQKTSARDLSLASRQYRELIQDLQK